MSKGYPALLNLYAQTNQTFNKVLTWSISGTPVNLTGYTAEMDIKWRGGTTPIVALSTGSGITLGGSAGTIAITVSASTMATLEEGTYEYDLVLISGSVKTPLVRGSFNVEEGVTQ